MSRIARIHRQPRRQFRPAWVLLGVILPAMQSMPVHAQQTARDDPELAVGIGAGDVLDSSPDFGYGAEYRFAPVWRDLRPIVGFNATEREDWYVYAGVRYFFWIGEAWRFDPTFAVGYFEAGGGIELGGSLEFRSGFEFSRRVSERIRLAVGFAHLSNARIYRSNPGTETVSLSIAVAL